MWGLSLKVLAPFEAACLTEVVSQCGKEHIMFLPYRQDLSLFESQRSSRRLQPQKDHLIIQKANSHG